MESNKTDFLNDDSKRFPMQEFAWWSRIPQNRKDDNQYKTLAYSILYEPLIQEFKDAEGKRIAIVTFNRYEAKVLNAGSMLIADIDIGDPQLEDGCFARTESEALEALEEAIRNVSKWAGPNRNSFEYWLFENGQFKRKLTAEQIPNYPDAQVVYEINEVKEAPRVIYCMTSEPSSLGTKFAQWKNSLFFGLGFRVYRTRGGLRYLCTTHHFNAGWDIEDKLLRFLYSDPRYRGICKSQKVFRARLTPKPWRVKFQDGAKTCQFVKTIGSGNVLCDFEEILRYHDLMTQAFEPHGYLA